MGAYIKPILQNISKTVHKTAEMIDDKLLSQTYELYKTQYLKDKIASRRAGKRTAARHWDLQPIDDIDEKIKNLLANKIIEEFRKKKLKHRQLAIAVRTSRPSITRVLNSNLKEVSIEFLLRILCSLGIHTEITFTS